MYAEKLNDYERGEWEMFSRITSAYYGKEYYFVNKDGTAYSRESHRDMTRQEAFNEFIANLLLWEDK